MAIRSPTVFNRSLALGAIILGLHCFILWLAPFDSLYPTQPTIALLTVFFVIFFVTAKLVLVLHGRRPERTPGSSFIQLERIFRDSRLLTFLVLLSFIGVCLHIWSKLYLTELRPISCISEIRFAWVEVDKRLLPLPIKLGSMLGHLLTSFAYLGILAASFNICQSQSVRSIKRNDLLVQIFFTLVGALYAGFIGSRNAMLAFLAMSLTGVILSMAFSEPQNEKSSKWGLHLTGVLVPFITATIFSSLIFSDRLFCYVPDALSQSQEHHVSKKELTEFHMGGSYREFALTPRADGDDGNPNWREKLFIDWCPICSPTIVYLNHGIFNLSKVMANEARGDPVLLSFFVSLPRRFGLVVAPANTVSNRVYGPGGVSLAGAAYHDFGMAGVVITAVVLGLLFGQSIRWMQSSGIRILVGVWSFASLFYVLLLSNIFVGFSVLPFPFIVFGIGVGFMVWLAMEWMRKGGSLLNHAGRNEITIKS